MRRVRSGNARRPGRLLERSDWNDAGDLRLARMPPPEFERDEVLVCMVIAFCIAAASVTTVYGLIG
jgi:hypothetical protein